MDNIHKISNKKLTWIQLSAYKNGFELKSEEGIFAQLKWGKPFGSLATAVTADGEWTFKRSGFLQPRVSVRKTGSDEDIATFKPGWTGAGTLDLSTGRRLSWINRSFLRSVWEFVDSTGGILRFKLKPGIFKLKVEMDIITDITELSLLAALGMYLLVLTHDDNTAATAAITSI
jgi:hypothetical protein